MSTWMFPKIVGFPPKSSILIGFPIIFTIHFGGFTPIFGSTPTGGKIRTVFHGFPHGSPKLAVTAWSTFWTKKIPRKIPKPKKKWSKPKFVGIRFFCVCEEIFLDERFRRHRIHRKMTADISLDVLPTFLMKDAKGTYCWLVVGNHEIRIQVPQDLSTKSSDSQNDVCKYIHIHI